MKRHLCGTHAVREALTARARDVAVVYVTDLEARGPVAEIIALARRHEVTVEVREAAELDALARGLRHQGVIALGAADYAYADLAAVVESARAPGASGVIVALDEITDPHNFGAIVRSAVALGADGVITLKDRAAPVTGVVIRASAGATEHCRIARVTNLARTLESLRDEGFFVVGLAGEGDRELSAVSFDAPTVIVVGSEGRGLRRLVRERCDVVARITLRGPVSSLNASVAGGIAIYEVLKARLGAVSAPPR